MSVTVGQNLRQAREDQSLSIETAALATRIKPHYLRALESGDLDALPSMAHARGFLRAYAEYLGLDAGQLLTGLDPKLPPTAAISAETQSPALDEASPVLGMADTRAAAIFTDLGAQLRHQRELLGLSLEDVERHTHLREHYLQALETGDLEGLPSPVQGRGMLNNYAAFLGMNPDPLLLRFAEGLQARLAARQAIQQAEKPTSQKRKRRTLPRQLRRLLSGDVLIGGALTVILGLFVMWIAIRIFAMTTVEATPTPTVASIAEVLLATATPSPSPTPAPPSPTAPAAAGPPTLPPATDPVSGAPITPNPGTGVQLYITVRQRAWMRVTVDGEVQFEGRVIPGSAYPFTGQSTVEVLTGSGSALQIFLNGVDLGIMGAAAETTGRIYTVEGLITPTPTITATLEPTLPATPTVPAATLPVPATPPAIP